ncbi:MAG: J domain-containing protein [Actinobacteria bacterium]|nr:J domain-containing protein [Actinomycetota bacterium]
MREDHYRTLGVAPDADAGAVRAAYLRVMRESHPDRRPGDAAAAATARRANAAWSVLRDRTRREAYDGLRASGAARVTHAPPAYSPAGADYRRGLHEATLRVGLVIFALGVVLLLTFS